MRAEEALGELERFLDAAVLNGLSQVSILHGKGTGRLQEAVRAALGADRRVQDSPSRRSSRGGRRHPGDAGVLSRARGNIGRADGVLLEYLR